MRRNLISMLGALALASSGCYTTHSLDLYTSGSTTPTQAINNVPIHVDVQVEWQNDNLQQLARGDFAPADGDTVGLSSVMVDPALPIFIGGIVWHAEHDAAKEAYKKMLAEELEAQGFRPVSALDPADYRVRVKLVNAFYRWQFMLVIVIPIWHEFPQHMLLAGEATLDTPEFTYERRVKVMEKGSGETERRFQEAWRMHAAQVARATAEQVEAEQGSRRP